MSPVNALLVTLGGAGRSFPEAASQGGDLLCLERDAHVRQAALLLVREKGGRYSMVREPIFLEKSVICWDPEWEDCFEVQEFNAKETIVFKVTNLNEYKFRKY